MYCNRNLSPAISGPSGLWKQAMILDPFLKRCQSQSIQSYTQLFELVTDIPVIEEEFGKYLLEAKPYNPELTARLLAQRKATIPSSFTSSCRVT